MLAVDRAVLIYYFENGESHSASGFRLDGEYILTADHCAEGVDYRVLIDGRNLPARVYLRTGRRDIDLAILRIDKDQHIERASCARIRTSHAAKLDQCCVLAFPEWKGNGRAQLDGYVPTGEAAVVPGLDAAADTSQLSFKCVTPPPASASRLAEITGDGAKKFTSQWRGASGGAIVHDGHVIGVLSNHVLPEGDSSLAFTPMTAIEDLSSEQRDRFMTVLGETPTTQWPVVPSGSAPQDGKGQDAGPGSVSLASPDAHHGAEAESLFRAGLHFAEEKDLVSAETMWHRAAEQGHPGAMNNLGNIFHEQRKLHDAHRWYSEAVKRGNVDAMGNLAGILHRIRDIRAAEQLWRDAADLGNTDSMYNLAVLMDKTQRFDEAKTLYRKAAADDHRDAMHNLAIRLRYDGVLDEATDWWKRAGHKRAQGPWERLRGLLLRRQSK